MFGASSLGDADICQASDEQLSLISYPVSLRRYLGRGLREEQSVELTVAKLRGKKWHVFATEDAVKGKEHKGTPLCRASGAGENLAPQCPGSRHHSWPPRPPILSCRPTPRILRPANVASGLNLVVTVVGVTLCGLAGATDMFAGSFLASACSALRGSDPETSPSEALTFRWRPQGPDRRGSTPSCSRESEGLPAALLRDVLEHKIGLAPRV